MQRMKLRVRVRKLEMEEEREEKKKLREGGKVGDGSATSEAAAVRRAT